MWKAGVSKESRIKAGQWATPEMDDVYLQQTIEEQRDEALKYDI